MERVKFISTPCPALVLQHRGGIFIVTAALYQGYNYQHLLADKAHNASLQFFWRCLFVGYKDYQNARDASWKILLDCGIDRLPVDLNVIRNRIGVRIVSYKDAKALILKRNLTALTVQTDGLTFYAGAEPVILYSEACSPERIRFTIAHELGHIVLGHVVPGSITTANREPSLGDSPQETAANQFAARLLAPACVLWGLDLHTADEIAVACRISKKAAQFRSERMKTLYARNKFLSSPLERKLYQRFIPFMEAVCCLGVRSGESLQSD